MSRRRRRLLLALGAIVALELAWVLTFEWAAKSGRLERWIARRPQRFQLSFAEAHSYFPLHVHLDRLRMACQTPRWQWKIEARSADALISPWPLLTRTLKFERLRGADLVFQARRRPSDEILQASSVPEIPDFTSIPGGIELDPPVKTPWSFELPRVELDAIREIWVEKVRLEGLLSAQGGFAIRDREKAEIYPSKIRAANATLFVAGDRLARLLSGSVSGRLAPYAYRVERGLKLLPHLSGRSRLRGEIRESALLARYLPRADWLELDDEPATFTSEIVVEKGALGVGSRLTAERPRRTIGIFGFETRGETRLQFAVNRDEQGPLGILNLRFNAFDVRFRGFEEPQVAGRGLEIVIRSRDLDLAHPSDDARITVDLGEARIPDLRSFQPLLPRSSGLEIRGGDGDIHARLEIDLARGSAFGGLSAIVERAAATLDDLSFEGRIDLEVPMSSRDLLGRRFDLAGARLDLSGFRVPPAKGAPPDIRNDWWASTVLREAELELGPSGALSGSYSLKMRDSVPLVQLYSARKDLPGWVKSLLTVPDVDAEGSFRWRPGEIRLESLETRLREARVRARLAMAPTRRHGQLLLEWKGLSLGVELVEGQRRLKIRRAREWFEREKL